MPDDVCRGRPIHRGKVPGSRSEVLGIFVSWFGLRLFLDFFFPILFGGIFFRFFWSSFFSFFVDFFGIFFKKMCSDFF